MWNNHLPIYYHYRTSDYLSCLLSPMKTEVLALIALITIVLVPHLIVFLADSNQLYINTVMQQQTYGF